MKYVPGLMVGQLSGKAGNTVASRNRSGSYMRTRVIPKLVRNIKTTAVRDIFTSQSQAFRDLTPAQVIGWDALGAQLIRKNSLGESFRMSGLQAYKSLNGRNAAMGNPILSDPPEFASAPSSQNANVQINRDATITATTVTTGATSATQVVGSTANVLPNDVFDDTTASVTARVLIVIDATHVLLDAVVTTVTADTLLFTRDAQVVANFSPSPIPAGVDLMIFMTAGLSGGITRPSKSQYRFIQGLAPSVTTGHDISFQYNATFGNIPAGTRVFAKVYYQTTTGFAGTPFEFEVANL